MLYLCIRELKTSTASKKCSGNQIKRPCAYSVSPSELFSCSSRTKRVKNHTFSYFIFWVWLLLCNVFHLWQADKLGFMWHNNRVPSTSLSIAKKYGAKENILLYRQPDCCEERNAMLVQCKKTTTLKALK